MLYEVIRRLNFMKTRELLILAKSIKFKALLQTIRNAKNGGITGPLPQSLPHELSSSFLSISGGMTLRGR